LVGVAVLVEVSIAAVAIAVLVRVTLLRIRCNYAVVGRAEDVISVYVIGPTGDALISTVVCTSPVALMATTPTWITANGFILPVWNTERYRSTIVNGFAAVYSWAGIRVTRPISIRTFAVGDIWGQEKRGAEKRNRNEL
jgi:hypothetical protein